MARVSVLIPAYRSGARIAETLQSVQDQTFADFAVRIAVEPTGVGDIDPATEQRFTADPRFHFYRNETVLGWAGNIDRLLSTVETDLFAILPHDDLWHRDFLAVLVEAMHAHPENAVAYPDVERIGSAGGETKVELDNRSVGRRLLSFYLGDANALPWRGLTRRSVLSPGVENFPDNPFGGYGAESEWAQRLLASGVAQRVPEALYGKRDYPGDYPSVSRNWVTKLSVAEKEAASELHRQRMLSGIPADVGAEAEREAVVLACEVAMLRRAFGLGRLGLTGERRGRAERIRSEAAKLPQPAQRQVLRYLDRVVAKIETGAARPIGRGSA